ncbi:MAG: NTP transferase domain-containing protein [Steroidobacteraceae bacterium]
MTAPVYGLVLAGGHSSRMGQDKAALEYHGGTQLERAFGLLKNVVARAFVSVRADQTRDPLRAQFSQIIDVADGTEGPAAGIRAAQLAWPDAAWLVLACDLPWLDIATLQQLIARRDPARVATAFRSQHDGLPEPLCAIYEPAAAAALVQFLATGRNCPRKLLINSDTLLLEQPNTKALDNVNTPQELAAALALSGGSTADSPRELRVQYFALLREQAGRREEAFSTCAATPRELFAELTGRHHFTLTPEHLKVAVNAEFSDWSRPLHAGDTVVFIPPVAGG